MKSSASQATAVAIGDNAVASHAGSVALGGSSATAAAVGTASSTIAGTTYNYAGTAPTSTVSIGSASNQRTLTNLAAGRVSASSTDAINGSQLNATNTEVTALDTRVDTLGASTATHLGGGATYNTTTGAVNAPTYNVGGSTFNNVGDALTNVDGRVTNNTTNISNLTNNINNGTIGLVQQDPTTNTITVAKDTDGKLVDFTGTDGERQLTGVDKGAVNATSTDAVNGSQLHATNTSITNALGGGSTVNPDGTITGPTYNIGGDTYNNVGDALTNVDGRVTNVEGAITNINNGAGIKYFHANSTLADSTATGTDSVAVGPVANASAANAVAVGNGSVADQAGAVALGAGSKTAAAVATTSGTVGGVSRNFAGAAPTSTVSVGDVGAERTVTNVAAGRVTGTSTDAVNGSQLFATNQAVDTNTTNISNLTNNINNGTVGLVQQDPTTNTITVAKDTDGKLVDFTGTEGERQLTGVDKGAVNATSVDAVNGSQLHATNSSIVDAIGGGSTVNPDGSITGPTFNIGGSTYNNVGDALTNVDGRVTNNTTNISNLTNNIANGTIGLVQQDPTSRDITVAKDTDGKLVDFTGTEGERQLTGVDKGAVNATSVDAVNGSQLHATNSSIVDAIGGGSTVNPDGSITGPTFNIGGDTYNNVGDALTNVDGRVTNVEGAITNINNGGGIKYFHANSTKADSIASGTDSIAVGPEAVSSGASATAVGAGSAATGGFSTALGVNAQANGGNSIALGQATVGAERAIAIGTNDGATPAIDADSHEAIAIGDHVKASKSIESVVLGAGASATNADESVALGNDAAVSAHNAVAIGNSTVASHAGAVALGAGAETAEGVTTASGTIAGTSYDYAGVAESTVSVGKAGHERSITNVAAGRVNATSTDAVNGSQLHATNTAVDKLDGQVQQNTTNISNLTNNINNGTIGLVQQDPATQVITVGKDTGGKEVNVAGTEGDRQVTGVANGDVNATSTDAVNGSQLHATNTSIVNAIGGGSTVNPDGSITGPTYNIGGNTYNNVGDALTNVDGRVTNVEGAITNINNGAGIKYFHANSTQADSAATGTDSVAVGPQAVASAQDAVAIGTSAQASHAGSVALGAGSQTTVGAQASYEGAYVGNSSSTGEVALGGRKVTGMAAGSADTDGVNVSQLKAGVQAANTYTDNRITEVQGNVGGAVTNIENLQKGADGMFQVSQDNTAKPTVSGPNSTAGGANAQATGANSTALGANSSASGSNSVAVGVGSVADRANSVSVGSAGNERTVSNVAAGSRDTDAVNVGQLRSSEAGNVRFDTNADGTVNHNSVTLNPGGAPTTVRNVADGVSRNDAVNVGQLNRAVDGLRSDQFELRRESRGGTASAMAAAGLPQANGAGKHMLAAGIGGYEGEVALAVGLSGVTDNNRYIYKAQVSTGTTQDFGFSVGAGIQW